MAGDARVRALARRNRHEEKTPHHGVPATQTPQTVGEAAGRRRGLVQMTAPPGVPPSLRGPRYKRSSSSRPSSGPPGSDTAATRLGHRKYSGTFFHLSTSTARRAIAPHHICCGQPLVNGNPNPTLPSIRDTFCDPEFISDTRPQLETPRQAAFHLWLKELRAWATFKSTSNLARPKPASSPLLFAASTRSTSSGSPLAKAKTTAASHHHISRRPPSINATNTTPNPPFTARPRCAMGEAIHLFPTSPTKLPLEALP